MLFRSRFVLSFLCFLPILTSCSANYEEDVQKSYKIYVKSQNPKLIESIKVLSNKFNDDLGIDALEVVNSEKDANSKISFIKGLRENHGKLGLGQWILTTVNEGRGVLPANRPLKKTLTYSMDLEFDEENFLNKSSDILEGRDETDNYQHLYHLFCHEVGHGLQMDHDDESHSVMYKSIPDSYAFAPEYDYFFNEARLFFE